MVLRDSGSNKAIVRGALVPGCLSGNTRHVRVLGRSLKSLQEAVIQVETPNFTGEVTGACLEKLIYDLVLGNLPGVRVFQDPDLNWKPRTLRSQEQAHIKINDTP